MTDNKDITEDVKKKTLQAKDKALEVKKGALEKTADERGCFTSRFQVWQVDCPKAADLVPLVAKWLPEKEAINICDQAGGGKAKLSINVRGLLHDVKSIMVTLMA